MSELTGYCKVCGSRYIKYRPNQKFCSVACSEEGYKRHTKYVKKPIVTKKCYYCKQEFKTNNKRKKFCCPSCAENAKKEVYHPVERKTIVCERCGTPFVTSNEMQKYCCKECRRLTTLERSKTRRDYWARVDAEALQRDMRDE